MKTLNSRFIHGEFSEKTCPDCGVTQKTPGVDYMGNEEEYPRQKTAQELGEELRALRAEATEMRKTLERVRMPLNTISLSISNPDKVYLLQLVESQRRLACEALKELDRVSDAKGDE